MHRGTVGLRLEQARCDRFARSRNQPHLVQFADWCRWEIGRDEQDALRRIQDRHIADSDVITREQWRQRSLATRWLQNMCRLTDTLI